MSICYYFRVPDLAEEDHERRKKEVLFYRPVSRLGRAVHGGDPRGQRLPALRPALLAGLQDARFLQRPDRAGLPVHRRLLVRHRGRAQVGRLPQAGPDVLEAVPALPADPAGRLPAARAALLAALPAPRPEAGRAAQLLGRRRAARHRHLPAAVAAVHPSLAAPAALLCFHRRRRPGCFAADAAAVLAAGREIPAAVPLGICEAPALLAVPAFSLDGLCLPGRSRLALVAGGEAEPGRGALLPPALFRRALRCR